MASICGFIEYLERTVAGLPENSRARTSRRSSMHWKSGTTASRKVHIPLREVWWRLGPPDLAFSLGKRKASGRHCDGLADPPGGERRPLAAGEIRPSNPLPWQSLCYRPARDVDRTTPILTLVSGPTRRLAPRLRDCPLRERGAAM